MLSPRLWAGHLWRHLQQLLRGTSKGCQKETKTNACFCMLSSPGDVRGNSVLFESSVAENSEYIGAHY